MFDVLSSHFRTVVMLGGLSLLMAGGCGPGEEEADNDANHQQNNGNDRPAPGEECDEVDCGDNETCYRGVCYEQCDADTDCADDRRCWAPGGHCVSIDCQGIECGLEEYCYYGVCQQSCNVDEDCDDTDAVCEFGACISPCFDDNGTEICPELQLETLLATDVGDTSATLHGQADELPEKLPEDHGLCWSTDPEPRLGEGDCQAMGPLFRADSFSHQVGNLQQDTTYHVSAFAQSGEQIEYAEPTSFTTGEDDPSPNGDDDYFALYTASDDGTVCKVTEDGEDHHWCYDQGDDRLLGVAVDVRANVYAAGSNEDAACRIDSEQNEPDDCYRDHNDRVNDVAVDADGYFYTASHDETACKVDAHGEQVWCFDGHVTDNEDTTGEVRAVAVDADGILYTASSDKTVCKVEDGGEDDEWCHNEHSDVVHDVAVDADGYVYSASWDATFCKVDAGGNKQWCEDEHHQPVRGIAVDADGYVYTASQDGRVCKFDADGDRQWCNDDHGPWPEAVAPTPDGYVYTGALDDTACRLTPGGDTDWCYDGHSNNVRDIAADPGSPAVFPDAW